MTIDKLLCGRCGGCVAVCGFDALALYADRLEEISGKCTSCRLCIVTCPSKALALRDEVKV